MAATYTNASAEVSTVAMIDARVFLGTTTTTADNDAFVEIGGLFNIPNYGPKRSKVTKETMKGIITEKGVADQGGGTFQFVRDFSDAGQTAALDAVDVAKGNYNLRIIFADKATSTGTGTMIDVKVKVLSAQDVPGGGPNNMLGFDVEMAYNSKPVKTAAT